MKQNSRTNKNWIRFRSTLKALKDSQEVLELLEEGGLDVDRLIGISNAQGPHAKRIRGLMLSSVDGMNQNDIDSDVAAVDLARHGVLRPVLELGAQVIDGQRRSKRKQARSVKKSRRKASTA